MAARSKPSRSQGRATVVRFWLATRRTEKCDRAHGPRDDAPRCAPARCGPAGSVCLTWRTFRGRIRGGERKVLGLAICQNRRHERKNHSDHVPRLRRSLSPALRAGRLDYGRADCAATSSMRDQISSRRYRLDADVHGAGAADDAARPRAVLRRHGAQEEPAVDHGAEFRHRLPRDRVVGGHRLQPGIHRGFAVAGRHYALRARGPVLRQGRARYR